VQPLRIDPAIPMRLAIRRPPSRGRRLSDRADDPLYSKYQKNKRLYNFIFASALIMFIPAALFLSGELSRTMMAFWSREPSR
jgi:hypothetical protein